MNLIKMPLDYYIITFMILYARDTCMIELIDLKHSMYMIIVYDYMLYNDDYL